MSPGSTPNQTEKKKPKDFGRSKTLDTETAKLFHSIKDKANKKEFGRKVTDPQILKLALSLITQEHIKKLQEASLTEEDRLNKAHQDYIKQHGKVSKSQFLGILLAGFNSPKNLEKGE